MGASMGLNIQVAINEDFMVDVGIVTHKVFINIFSNFFFR